MKELLAKEKGEDVYPVASQKLIYAGKILADDDPVQKYSINEKKFIVVMVTKPKPVPAKATTPDITENKEAKDSELKKALETAPKSNGEGTQKKDDVPDKKVEEKPETKRENDKDNTNAETATKTETGSGMVVGEDYEKMVQNIVDMGYERSKAIAALKASFNNPERAIKYLVSGLPAMDEMEDSLPAVPSQAHTESSDTPSTP